MSRNAFAGPLCAVWFCLFACRFSSGRPTGRPQNLSCPREIPPRLCLRRGDAEQRAAIPQCRRISLATRMIYNDGLNVMLSFGGVYAAGVFHWGETEVAAYGISPVGLCGIGRLVGRQSCGPHRNAARAATFAFGDDCGRNPFPRLCARIGCSSLCRIRPASRWRRCHCSAPRPSFSTSQQSW